ncbi:gamma-glutamyltransferase [Magnetovibrio sp. PR-2]|uniref:gamma-glutamyltransferase n=1 Tax=Magnetovibrio sp. PR-2 TaxID=3120356 RepID=UPI002FCE25FF
MFSRKTCLKEKSGESGPLPTHVSVSERKTTRFARQISSLVLALGVAACSSGEEKLAKGSVGYVEGFLGGVVADEPRAALVGRDILSSGGSAGDAAAAMYFTLAVTLPSRAGLGGGGVCVAFDQAKGETDVVDFTAQAPKTIPPSADRPSAIPSNARGIFAMQARYGRLLWAQVVAPAEKLARFGHPVSRAFARDLNAIGQALLRDPNARAIFASKRTGKVLTEGETLEQLELAATLGRLRARGVGPFYTGPFAKIFVEGVTAVGGSLNVEALRAYKPQVRDTVKVKVGFEVAHFAPPPAAASTQTAAMLAMLLEQGDYDGADVSQRAHFIGEAGVHAFADRETWLNSRGAGTKSAEALSHATRYEKLSDGLNVQGKTAASRFLPAPRNRHETPATTSFLAADPEGNAVACAVTMNSSFGTGRVVPGTGVVLAAAPGAGGRGPTGLAPMLIVNENSNEFRMAASANGGAVAPSVLASTILNVVEGEMSVSDAIAAPRIHNGGDPDVTYFEAGLDESAKAHLSTLGHRTAATPVLGQVNMLYCGGGLPTKPATCQMKADPRGAGLAAGTMN